MPNAIYVNAIERAVKRALASEHAGTDAYLTAFTFIGALSGALDGLDPVLASMIDQVSDKAANCVRRS
ncbi:hypothetical protein INH39_02965 [Massilia violaceinigra]|uniref:DUF3077 domain-containing protein n=1 Tax=Massilia violaceinigra TaxID=2045208 RepID=A0ABY4A7G5_9BURK|nr:hypothetical protein [Massilia violaceinigra]UOD30722.1 hypothetical protein INH39_02965 [Massilia violaceinigra]